MNSPAVPGARSDGLEIRLFGHFEACRGQQSLTLPTRKAESLLAFLILNPGPHGREKLARLFWPDAAQAAARASLRSALSSLRRNLSEELLSVDRESLQLNTKFDLWVDTEAFREAATRFCEDLRPDPDTLDLSLYRSDCLSDRDDEWLRVEREKLRQLYFDALLRLIRLARTRGDFESGIRYSEKLLASDPTNEPAHQHLIFCHAALGNRDAALAQARKCRQTLARELDAEPSVETRKLVEWIRQTSMQTRRPEASITNLPISLTSFVERPDEVEAINALLQASRLVALTGAGGVGKTRLAVRVAMNLLETFPEGAWFVDLADLEDEEQLTTWIATSLGIREMAGPSLRETLAGFIGDKHLLLLLDNCDHVVRPVSSLIGFLLGGCPGLVVLATSRESLTTPGCQRFSVPTLAIPDGTDSNDIDRLSRVPSIRLFLERARSVRPDFEATKATMPAVARICRSLDGLPLAIELAAGMVGVLSVEQIAGRIERYELLPAFGQPVGESRHVALGAAIAESDEQLTPAQRKIFRRVSVFAGGWSLAAAEEICTGDDITTDRILPLLGELAGKSLIIVEPRDDIMRYRMLRPIRAYCSDRLESKGADIGLRSRHRAYFVRFARALPVRHGFFAPDDVIEDWGPRIEDEYRNLRAAARRHPEDDPRDPSDCRPVLELLCSLHWFWFLQGRFSDGLAWFEEWLDDGTRSVTPEQSWAMLTVGFLHCWRGDFSLGQRPISTALDQFRKTGEIAGKALAHHGLGHVAMGVGDLETALAQFGRAIEIARAEQDQWMMSFSSHFRGISCEYAGRLDEARRHLQEGNTLLEKLGGHRQGVAFADFHLGRIARLNGDMRVASERLRSALLTFEAAQDRRGIGFCLAGFANLAALEGAIDRAAMMLGAVAALEEELGTFLEQPLHRERLQEEDRVRRALGQKRFEELADSVRSLPLSRTIDVALGRNPE